MYDTAVWSRTIDIYMEHDDAEKGENQVEEGTNQGQEGANETEMIMKSMKEYRMSLKKNLVLRQL